MKNHVQPVLHYSYHPSEKRVLSIIIADKSQRGAEKLSKQKTCPMGLPSNNCAVKVWNKLKNIYTIEVNKWNTWLCLVCSNFYYPLFNFHCTLLIFSKTHIICVYSSLFGWDGFWVISHNFLFLSSKSCGSHIWTFVWMSFGLLFPLFNSLIFEWWVMKIENIF